MQVLVRPAWKVERPEINQQRRQLKTHKSTAGHLQWSSSNYSWKKSSTKKRQAIIFKPAATRLMNRWANNSWEIKGSVPSCATKELDIWSGEWCHDRVFKFWNFPMVMFCAPPPKWNTPFCAEISCTKKIAPNMFQRFQEHSIPSLAMLPWKTGPFFHTWFSFFSIWFVADGITIDVATRWQSLGCQGPPDWT